MGKKIAHQFLLLVGNSRVRFAMLLVSCRPRIAFAASFNQQNANIAMNFSGEVENEK